MTAEPSSPTCNYVDYLCVARALTSEKFGHTTVSVRRPATVEIVEREELARSRWRLRQGSDAAMSCIWYLGCSVRFCIAILL